MSLSYDTIIITDKVEKLELENEKLVTKIDKVEDKLDTTIFELESLIQNEDLNDRVTTILARTVLGIEDLVKEL